MANTYKVIDEKTWNRAMHCKIFRDSIEPAFCVTYEADITGRLCCLTGLILHLRISTKTPGYLR